MDILEYVKNERRTFSQKAFSILDSMVLSTLTYIKFDNIIPEEGILLKDTFKAENFDTMLKLLPRREEYEKLYILMVLSPRYRDIRLKHYLVDNDHKKIKQFSAITFILGDKIYVAYRGTDNTILGWNENFHMTYEYPVESQKQAVKYLAKVYSMEKKKILLGGHSKGGNLALYAAINSDITIQKNIIKAYSFDGPGFPEEVYKSKEYKAIRDKIVKVVPQESIIGLLFEKDTVLVCKSAEKGVLQHDLFFWKVKDNDLIYLKALSKSSLNFNKAIMKWLESATIEERELFVSTLFSLLKNEKIVNFHDDLSLIHKTPDLIKAYNKLDSERKEFMIGIFKKLIPIIIEIKDEGKSKRIKKVGNKEKEVKEEANKENKEKAEVITKKIEKATKETKQIKNNDENKNNLIDYFLNKYFGTENDREKEKLNN